MLAILTVGLVSVGAGSCLPVDTRPPAGSILLTLTSDDEPSVTTADGWSIAVDRLLLGIGNASLGYDEASVSSSSNRCTHYSDAHYGRLLDGRLRTDQKIGSIFGLGQCDFYFQVAPPYFDTLLGEGVSEADKERMGGADDVEPWRRPPGIAVDFAATATRGPEIKRVHWTFHQGIPYDNCKRTVAGVPSQLIELRSDTNFTLHIGYRSVSLFGDDADPTIAVLRFDPIASADTLPGDGDGEITLDELGGVPLELARQAGRYGIGSGMSSTPQTLKDYLYVVLLPRLGQFREDIDCDRRGYGPP